VTNDWNDTVLAGDEIIGLAANPVVRRIKEYRWEGLIDGQDDGQRTRQMRRDLEEKGALTQSLLNQVRKKS
jgi:hypothetical protein